MSIDLSKAIEAGSTKLWEHRNLSAMDEGRDEPGTEPRDEYDCCARDAINAAMPHILEALAGWADRDYAAAEDADRPGLMQWACDAADWLRTKAEESRG